MNVCLTFQTLAFSLYTTTFDIKKFYVLPALFIYVLLWISKFEECLLLFRAESFIFHFAIQKVKDQDI